MPAFLRKTFVFAAILSAANVALAFNPQPEPPPGTTVGVVATQVVSVTVIAPPEPILPPEPVFPDDPFLPPDPILPPEPIQVIFGLYDETGLLVRADRAMLTPGKLAAINVSGRELGALDGERVRVYAVVHCLGGRAARAECAATVQPALEIVDADTGETMLLQRFAATSTPVQRLR